jgi:hypothetical protein
MTRVGEFDVDLTPAEPGPEWEWPAAAAVRVESRCTGCEASTGPLVPWAGERLCLACVDLQLDLTAKALMEDLPVQAGGSGLR